MPLVVVHGDDQVVVAASGEEESGVGGEWAAGVDAVGAQGLERGHDLLCLLAVAEQAVLAGVRIDAAHPDERILDPGADQRVVAAADGALDQAAARSC